MHDVNELVPHFLQNIWKKSWTEKKKIDEALIQMITLDVQPFKIVDDVGFKNFVHCLEPKYDLPSRTTLRQVLLKNMFMDMKAQSKSILVVDFVQWQLRDGDHVPMIITSQSLAILFMIMN